MNAKPRMFTPAPIGSTRSATEHAAIYQAYIVDDLTAEAVARYMQVTHGTKDTRASICAYADRQDWQKMARSGARTGGGKGKFNANTPKFKKGKPGPRAAILLDMHPMDPETGKFLKSCVYPVGPEPAFGAMDTQLFCGEIVPAQLPDHKPPVYCAACAAGCYPPKTFKAIYGYDPPKN